MLVAPDYYCPLASRQHKNPNPGSCTRSFQVVSLHDAMMLSLIVNFTSPNFMLTSWNVSKTTKESAYLLMLNLYVATRAGSYLPLAIDRFSLCRDYDLYAFKQ